MSAEFKNIGKERGALHRAPRAELSGSAKVITTRVNSFFKDAKKSLTDGTKQRFGTHTVVIMAGVAEDESVGRHKTTYKARFPDGTAAATREVYTDPAGSELYDIYTLHGRVDREPVTLTCTLVEGKTTGVIVDMPHGISRRKISAAALDEEQKDTLQKEFKIKF